MPKQKLPPGMTEANIKQILAHYEGQSEDEAVTEDEAAFASPEFATMQVPFELVGDVRNLIASKAQGGRSSPAAESRVSEKRKPYGKG